VELTVLSELVVLLSEVLVELLESSLELAHPARTPRSITTGNRIAIVFFISFSPSYFGWAYISISAHLKHI
jgi:hypothetical protein